MATAIIEDWATATNYEVGQMVFVEGQGAQFVNKLYRCIVAHTSNSWATDWGNSNWEEKPLKGYKGDTGEKGEKGDTGPTGATGAPGANGGNGADGIFSAIASQAEAQTGTENTKGMTALRTAQAIASQVPNLSAITDLENDVATLDGYRIDHGSRLNILEGLSPLTRARGEQRINNNQSSAQDIQGSGLPGQNGKGNDFMVDSDNATSYRAEVEIYREDDAEIRFSTVVLRFQYVNGTWYVARENTTVLVGGDDGVEFVLNDLGAGKAQVQYTSDNMAGGNYVSTSYVRYLMEQLNKSF